MSRMTTFSCFSLAYRHVLTGLFLALVPFGTVVAVETPALPTVLYACELYSLDLLSLDKQEISQKLQIVSPPAVVVTGGAFAAARALADPRPEKTRALLKAGGVSLCNLSEDDMLFLSQSTDKMAGTNQPALVSASFQAEAQGWKSVQVLETEGKRTAFIGVCALPADSNRLPELAGKGIRYREPATAIREALKEVPTDCPLVVLGHGDPVTLSTLETAFPSIPVFLISGTGIGGLSHPIGTRTYLAPSGGKGFAVYGSRKASEIASGTVLMSHSRGFSARAAEWSAFEKSEGLAFKPVNLAALTFANAPGSGTGSPACVLLEPGKTIPIAVSGKNKAVCLQIEEIRLLDSVDGLAGDPAKKYLSLKTVWKNLLRQSGDNGEGDPDTYEIPSLAAHLNVVADDCRSLPFAAMEGLTGYLGNETLTLRGKGALVRGKLLFEVAADRVPKTLELAFFDSRLGSFRVPLVVPPVPPAPFKMIGEPGRNAVMEIRVGDLATSTVRESRQAPPGMMFVTLELHGRSLKNGNPLEGSDAGETAYVDWQEARKYTHLVVDGEYAFLPTSGSRLPEVPRFIPELFTGEMLEFLVPLEARSMVLRCDFPGLEQSDEEGKRITPFQVFSLTSQDQPVGRPEKPALVTATDEPFRVEITHWAFGERCGELTPSEGMKLLQVEGRVRNPSAGGEFFQIQEQLKWKGPEEALTFHELARHLPWFSGDIIWVPSGETRAFQLLWEVPVSEQKPVLLFTGTQKAEDLVLPPKP